MLSFKNVGLIMLATVSTVSMAGPATDVEINSVKNIPKLESGVTYKNGVVTWVGPFEYGELMTFEVLTEGKRVNKIRFDSNGGRATVGDKMAEFVKNNNVEVEILRFCDSACTTVAINSPKLSGPGILGFHLSYLPEPSGDMIGDIGYMLLSERIKDDNASYIKMWKDNPYLTDSDIELILSESNMDVTIDYSVEYLNSNLKK